MCYPKQESFTFDPDAELELFDAWTKQFNRNDITINLELNKFIEPHKIITQRIEEAQSSINKDNFDDAVSLIQKTKNEELSSLEKLFENLK